MNKVKITLGALAVIMAACTPSKQVEEPTLKDVFKDKFLTVIISIPPSPVFEKNHSAQWQHRKSSYKSQ